MSVEVRVPTVLRPAMGGQTTVDAEGATIREVLVSLTKSYPSLAGQLLDDGGTLHRFLNVYSTTTTCATSGASTRRSSTATRSPCCRRSPGER